MSLREQSKPRNSSGLTSTKPEMNKPDEVRSGSDQVKSESQIHFCFRSDQVQVTRQFCYKIN